MYMLNGAEVIGHADAEGGCQWAVFANECSGAKVVRTGGFDYGSWVEFAGEIDEEDYKKLKTWENMDYSQRTDFINHLEKKYADRSTAN